MKRVRIVKYIVQPVAVLDDGDALTEYPLAPMEVPASEWDAFPQKWAGELRSHENSLNGIALGKSATSEPM